MNLSSRDRNIIIGAALAVVIVGLLAFLLGRGCEGEEQEAVRTVTARTATAPDTTGTATAPEPPDSLPAPHPSPSEPEPAPSTAPMAASDTSWGCTAFASDPGNEGCITGSPVDWMALISGGDPVSVTVTITGPEPTTTISLTKGGLHDPGSPAIEWYATAPAPMTKGIYNYSFTIVESDGTTTVIDSDPVTGPFTLPVAIP